MLKVTVFSIVAAALAVALAVQVPLDTGDQRWENEGNSGIFGEEDLAKWNFHEHPNPDGTDHLIFETVHSLLQHWPNTRMRNGHTIVPGIIPNGTLVYHGRSDKKMPTGPEWVATDPEHSYLFTRAIFGGPELPGGWHLTYMATRPLKIVYFDGSSAVKMSFGSMDTQDLIVWGKPSKNDNVLEEDAERGKILCEWGNNFGVDGFVRMEMDFEVMLCDFTSGVNLVSFDHVASKLYHSTMVSSTEAFEVIHAGAWHNRFPGETRIQLNLAGLVSFYDTQLVPSLVVIRAGQERWDHRAINVSSEDLSAVKSRLAANLMRPVGASSGIDWKTLFQVVVDRYAERLDLTRYLLTSPATDPDAILDLAKKAQAQLRIMLTPYILLSATPTNSSNQTELDWATPIYKLCATIHTRSMEFQFESMTDSEKLLLGAVRGTSREICRVITKMWIAGVYAGLDSLLDTKESLDVAEITHLRDIWAKDINALMTWLDWSTWVRCNPGCDVEETCYIPTWPVGFPWTATFPPEPPSPPIDDFVPRQGMSSLALRAMVMSKLAREAHGTFKPDPDEWIRPRPRCVRRVHPYRY